MKRKTPYWWGVIEKAKERRSQRKQGFTIDQVARAGDWVTCACGKQDKRIESFAEGTAMPLDARLRRMGVDFADAVSADHPGRAAQVLLRIEKRAAQLLSGAAVSK